MFKKLKLTAALLAGIITLGAAQAADTIVIKGSDTLGAKMVPQWAEEFKSVMKKQGVDVTFEIAAEGSSTGVAAVIDGTADVGMSSRDPKDTEYTKAKSNGIAMTKIAVANDGIAIIVNEANPMENITLKQIEMIFTGDIQDWSAVSANSGEISAYTRNTSSGTYKVFQKLALQKRDYGSNTQKMAGNEQIASEVAKNPNGIGYVGLAYTGTPGVKVLTVEGVEPTFEDITKGTYPIARPLYLLYDKNKELPDLVNLYLAFGMSPKGQAIVERVGFVPLY